MIFERNKLILVTLLFLAVAGFYILFDAKDTRDENVILKYSYEHSRDYSYDAVFSGNGLASSGSGRRRASHLTTSSDSVGGATINSAYFTKKKGAAVSILNSSYQNRSISISSTKKTNAGGGGSSYSSSTVALSSSKRGSSLGGLICENHSTTSFGDNSTASNKPMRVDEDPGEPPIPVGDGVWILMLSVFLYVVKYKIKK